MDRRTFVASTAWTAWLMAMLGGLSPEELLGASDGGAATGAHEEFWDAFFDDVDPSKPHVALRGAEQPLPAYVDSEKTPRYFHYQDDKGLRFAENIDRSELPKFPGPALVSVSLSGFHASDSDVKKIGEVSAAQLQLHAVQTTPIAQYIAPLAWASLATVYQKKVSKLPTVDQLNFVSEDGSGTSSSVSRVLYPKGEGKFAVNVTLPPKDSILHRMLMNGMKAAQVAAPLVSLPAISVPAIKAFTSFYNTLQQNAGFIINSPLKDVVTTDPAVDSGSMHADALKLLTGQYVVVPSGCSDALSKQMGDYKMVSGYLVPKTIGPGDDPQEVAQNSLRGITYASMKITVEPATSEMTAETPKGAPAAEDAPPPDDDTDAAKPAAPAKGKQEKKH